jgi:hypothetical protein
MVRNEASMVRNEASMVQNEASMGVAGFSICVNLRPSADKPSKRTNPQISQIYAD